MTPFLVITFLISIAWLARKSGSDVRMRLSSQAQPKIEGLVSKDYCDLLEKENEDLRIRNAAFIAQFDELKARFERLKNSLGTNTKGSSVELKKITGLEIENDRLEKQLAYYTKKYPKDLGIKFGETKYYGHNHKDDWDPYWEVAARDSDYDVAATIVIEYRNSDHEKSFRMVDVSRLHRTGETSAIVMGFCHLRLANRSFRTERIIKWFLPDEEKEQAGTVFDYIWSRVVENTPKLRIKNEMVRPLGALLYVAMADGRITKAEKIVLYDYYQMQSGDMSLSEEKFVLLLEGISVPDENRFKKFVSCLDNKDVKARDFLECSERIINTQKSVTKREAEVIDYLRGKIFAGSQQG